MGPETTPSTVAKLGRVVPPSTRLREDGREFRPTYKTSRCFQLIDACSAEADPARRALLLAELELELGNLEVRQGVAAARYAVEALEALVDYTVSNGGVKVGRRGQKPAPEYLTRLLEQVDLAESTLDQISEALRSYLQLKPHQDRLEMWRLARTARNLLRAAAKRFQRLRNPSAS